MIMSPLAHIVGSLWISRVQAFLRHTAYLIELSLYRAQNALISIDLVFDNIIYS